MKLPNAIFIAIQMEGILTKRYSNYTQRLKSAILAIFQKSTDGMNWTCPDSATLKNPSVELKTSLEVARVFLPIRMTYRSSVKNLKWCLAYF